MHAAGSAPLVMRNARLQRIAQRKFIARVVLAAGLVLAIVATYGVDRSLEEIARQRLAMAARSAATYVSAFVEALEVLRSAAAQEGVDLP